jgi:hypothetical protein
MVSRNRGGAANFGSFVGTRSGNTVAFYLQEQTEMQIRLEMDLTHTQYRLLKWRSKARFEQLSRKQLASRHLQVLCANNSQ